MARRRGGVIFTHLEGSSTSARSQTLRKALREGRLTTDSPTGELHGRYCWWRQRPAPPLTYLRWKFPLREDKGKRCDAGCPRGGQHLEPSPEPELKVEARGSRQQAQQEPSSGGGAAPRAGVGERARERERRRLFPPLLERRLLACGSGSLRA